MGWWGVGWLSMTDSRAEEFGGVGVVVVGSRFRWYSGFRTKIEMRVVSILFRGNKFHIIFITFVTGIRPINIRKFESFNSHM